MLPKVQFKVSWVHNLMFDKNRYLPKAERTAPKYQPSNGSALREKTAPFVKEFEKKSESILKTIQQKTGFNWKRDRITVYLSDTVPNSYEDPLTLKYTDKENVMLVVLIHELVHNNIPAEIQEKLPDEKRELCTEIVTKEVCDSLGIHSSNYQGFFPEEVAKHAIKPKELTIKEFLNRP